MLGEPLDPWQEWLSIHAGELLPDGRPRFRVVLIIVARQNGKTQWARVCTLFWLYVECCAIVLGMNSLLEYAREQFNLVKDMVEADPETWGTVSVRKTNGQEEMTTDACSWACRACAGAGKVHERTRYKIAAANRKAGRSLPLDRVLVDELREHRTWDAYNAAINAMNARSHAQAIAITNQGDDESVVLDALRDSAHGYLDDGVGDDRLGIFEWSAAEGSAPDDVVALAQANPNLNRRIELESLIGAGRRAAAPGADPVMRAGFLTEVLCIRVRVLDPAIDPRAWELCRVDGDLAGLRESVAAALDVSPDGQHITLAVAAAMPDGRVRLEVARAWEGPRAGVDMGRELPKLLAEVRPRRLGWFPGGPAAAHMARLRPVEGVPRPGWPVSVEVAEITGEVTAVCMGMAAEVGAGQLVHSGDPLLDAHVTGATKLVMGDAWRFSRRGGGHVDAAYAAAGAAHLARTLPPPAGSFRVIGPT